MKHFIFHSLLIVFLSTSAVSFAQNAVETPIMNTGNVSAPSEQGLNGLTPDLIQATADKINQAEPVLKRQTIEESTFYDGNAVVNSGGGNKPNALRRSNPRLEPASKLVVVHSTRKAGTKIAQVVAAERAMKLGRYDAAYALYDKLYMKSKSDPSVLLGRASALQNLGRTDEAVVAYEELLRVRPDLLEAQINMLGLMSEKYPSVALRRLLSLRDTHPDNAGIVAQISVVYAELGQYQDAIQNLGVAASLEPQNPGHAYNMAIIADRSGDRDSAITYYEQALEVDTIYAGGRGIPRDRVFERLAQLR